MVELMASFILWFELLIAYRVQLLQDIDEHGFLCLDISFVGVANEIHIHFSVACLSLLLIRPVERIFLIKLVEVLITDLRGDLRYVRRRHLPDSVPVDAFEEWVRLDLIDSISAQSRFGVANQSFQDVGRCLRQVSLWRHLEGLAPVHDLLAGDRRFIGEERRVANEHFEEDAADGPPVDRLIVALLPKHFWSDVIRRADGGECKLSRPLVSKFLVKCRFELVEVERKLFGVDLRHPRRPYLCVLAQSEISQFDVAISID